MGSSPGRAVQVNVAGLKPGETRSVEAEGTSVLLCNVDGEIYAIENRCSHAAFTMTDGPLVGCELECPVHGAIFDVRDGRALALPAAEPLRVFSVVRRGEKVEIDL